LGVKRPGREDNHSPSSSAEVKECVEIYLHSQYAFMAWCSVIYYISIKLEMQVTQRGRRRTVRPKQVWEEGIHTASRQEKEWNGMEHETYSMKYDRRQRERKRRGR
jgi:hypothetical protein